MHRRTVLATGALTLALPVTGCLGGDGDEPGTQGDDDDPLDADPESLLLTADQVEAVDGRTWVVEGLLGEGRENRPIMHVDDTVTRRIDPAQTDADDPRPPMVLSGVWDHDDVDSARTAYQDHTSYEPWAEEEGEYQVDIAVESMARIITQPATADFNGHWIFVLFRDANVLGAVSYRKELRPDEDELAERGVELGIEMHRNWRE